MCWRSPLKRGHECEVLAVFEIVVATKNDCEKIVANESVKPSTMLA
jgi:hypothetical protein